MIIVSWSRTAPFWWVSTIYILFETVGMVKSVFTTKNSRILSRYFIGTFVEESLGSPPKGAWMMILFGVEKAHME